MLRSGLWAQIPGDDSDGEANLGFFPQRNGVVLAIFNIVFSFESWDIMDALSIHHIQEWDIMGRCDYFNEFQNWVVIKNDENNKNRERCIKYSSLWEHIGNETSQNLQIRCVQRCETWGNLISLGTGPPARHQWLIIMDFWPCFPFKWQQIAISPEIDKSISQSCSNSIISQEISP